MSPHVLRRDDHHASAVAEPPRRRTAGAVRRLEPVLPGGGGCRRAAWRAGAGRGRCPCGPAPRPSGRPVAGRGDSVMARRSVPAGISNEPGLPSARRHPADPGEPEDPRLVAVGVVAGDVPPAAVGHHAPRLEVRVLSRWPATCGSRTSPACGCGWRPRTARTTAPPRSAGLHDVEGGPVDADPGGLELDQRVGGRRREAGVLPDPGGQADDGGLPPAPGRSRAARRRRSMR